MLWDALMGIYFVVRAAVLLTRHCFDRPNLSLRLMLRLLHQSIYVQMVMYYQHTLGR